MNENERGSGMTFGEAMSNGPKALPIGWELREAQELLQCSFWQMA